MKQEKARVYGPLSTFLSTIYILAISLSAAYTSYYLIKGYDKAFLFGLSVMAGFGACLLFSRKQKYRTSFLTAIAVLIITVSGTVFFFGLQSGVHYYLLVANVLLSMNISISRKKALPLSIGLAVVFIFIIIYFKGRISVYSIPKGDLGLIREINILSSFTLLALSFHRYSRVLKSVENELNLYHNKVARMASTDDLTNMPNRRSLENAFDSAMKHFNQNDGRKGFAIAIGDIDDFKKINDSYGHKCGDDILVKVASLLQKDLRSYDFAGRWGGEEFLFILRDTTANQAYHTMERIRSEITSRAIDSTAGPLRVTITFGVAQYRSGESKKSLFERADKLLYEGKKAGKNRVMIDEAAVEN